jgi:hypothetical protein
MKRHGKRPGLTRALRTLVRDIAKTLPELAHVRAGSVLIVAGEARRASHASIGPMAFPRSRSFLSPDGKWEKPRIRIRGKPVLYVITLRPIWFRASTAEERVGTLIHELYHCSTRFDGTLHPGRRHARMGPRFSKKLGPLVRRYLRDAPREVLAPLRFRGVVKVRMWLEKPPARLARGARARKLYTEEQLFIGLVRMR